MKRWVIASAALIAAPVFAEPKTVISLDQHWQMRIDPSEREAVHDHPNAAPEGKRQSVTISDEPIELPK